MTTRILAVALCCLFLAGCYTSRAIWLLSVWRVGNFKKSEQI